MQKIVSDAIPPTFGYVSHARTFYPENYTGMVRLLKNSKFKQLLNDLKLTPHANYGIALNLTKPNSAMPIHTDIGEFVYSFNIPIAGYSNSCVNIYESISEPVIVKDLINGEFIKFTEDNCRLVEQFKTDCPYILNTQIPHKVVNNSDETRLMLLVRLCKSFDPTLYF